MAILSPVKPVLKRGALIAAANWPLAFIQATADSLFKLLIATPVLAGVFLVGVVVGAEPRELMTLEWREMATTIVSSLLSHPLALAAFLSSVAVVVVGGSLFVFLVKGGTVAVLVRGERDADPIEDVPLHLETLATAARFSPERYIDASRSLFPRYARLGAMLIAVYVASGIGYLAAVFAIGMTGDTIGLTALATAAFVLWITLVNLVYLLLQIVVAADDCSIPAAVRRVSAFIRHERRVGTVFLAVLGLVVTATGASVLATIALGLIAFVPFVGLAVLPLQLLAWLLRGLVFQYIGLTSIGTYLRLYRTYTHPPELP